MNLTAPENDSTYAVGTKIELSWELAEQAQLTELPLERVGGPTVALSGTTATSANITLPDRAGVFTYRLTATNAGGTATKDIQLSTGTRPTIVGLEPVEVEGSSDFNLRWRMEGTGPFRFVAQFEVDTASAENPTGPIETVRVDVVAAIDAEGNYSATIERSSPSRLS